MRWQSRERRALRAVLAEAGTRPQHCLPLDAVPSARQHFADRRELLLALQREWHRLFWAEVQRLAVARPGPGAAEIAAVATAHCARRHPALRDLLDRHAGELLTTSFAAPVPPPVPPSRTAPRSGRVACPA